VKIPFPKAISGFICLNILAGGCLMWTEQLERALNNALLGDGPT